MQRRCSARWSPGGIFFAMDAKAGDLGWVTQSAGMRVRNADAGAGTGARSGLICLAEAGRQTFHVDHPSSGLYAGEQQPAGAEVTRRFNG